MGVDSTWLIYIAAIIAIFYFLMIRPQKRKEQQRRTMLENLKRGSRVVTIGGMYGVITSVKGTEVILRVDEAKDMRIKLLRSAVSRIVDDEKQQEEGESIQE